VTPDIVVKSTAGDIEQGRDAGMATVLRAIEQ
jgi:hypothetical protein